MVVRLTDSQIAAFEAGGISQDQIGTMIANARSRGIGDDLIYSDLANRAAAFANYAGMQIKADEKKADENIQNIAERIAAETERQSAPRRAKTNEPLEGAMLKDLRTTGGDGAFFDNKTGDVLGDTSKAYAAQIAAFNEGKNYNALEAFITSAGDQIMLSAEDFVFPDAELKRAGATEAHPVASTVGNMAGFALGIGGKMVGGAVKLVDKGLMKAGLRSAEDKLAGKAVSKGTGKKLLGWGAKSVVDAAVGTAALAAQDAVRAASKNDEWRTYRIDGRRYSEDFMKGLGWNALLGGAGYTLKWRRGARQAANRLGGIEKIQILQKERQRRIDNGMDPVEATELFRRDLIGTLTPEEQKAVAYAAKNDPVFRQYLNDIATTMSTDIERSANAITRREIKKATDDSMNALKRNQNLGDTDFDSSAQGLLDALDINSAKNIEAGKNLAKEGNIILSQDPAIHADFKAKTRKAVADMGDNKAYNALIEGAEAGNFEQVRELCKSQNIPLNSPQAKKIAQDYAKKLLDEGFDSVSQLNEIKNLIDTTANSGAIKAGKGTRIGGMREELNSVLETSFGDATNPATLSGKFRGYHNVKHFGDIMQEAHQMGKTLDPNDAEHTLSNYLNSHGTASADEAIAISTAVKMGYLDKLKDLAKTGQHDKWKKAVNDAKKNPQLNALLGGEAGIQEYMRAMEPEVKAAQSLKNIMVSATPGLKAETMAQEAIGTVVAAATNSPIATANHLMRIWQHVVPGGVTPAVGKNMAELMEKPTWSNLNKFIQGASKDPATRQQLARVVEVWGHEISAGLEVGSEEIERYGLQNTPAFEGGQ